MCEEIERRVLTHQVQAQARLIEQLRSRGLFGFFQRRRLRKMQEAGQIAVYLREDFLRAAYLALKELIRRGL